jgi:preprotein translocase subunit SecA
MPTPQQMALLRAAAAQRALAAQRAAAAQAAGAAGAALDTGIANGSGTTAAAGNGATAQDGTPVAAEQIGLEDLELGPEDLATVDELPDADVLPSGAAPDPEAAQAVVAGLAAAPRRMTLQHGDEAVDTGVRTAASSNDPGAKLGRNDPCWCGSGLKYKKCHGR